VGCGFQYGWVCSGRAPERVVLALRLVRACCLFPPELLIPNEGQPGSRTSGSGGGSGAAGLQNKRFWGSRALERAVLGCGFQDGLVRSGRAPERVVLALRLARARCGTRSSGANGQQNEWFWGSQALERVVMGQPGSRTRGSGAAGL
jgi:hypothetical protein